MKTCYLSKESLKIIEELRQVTGYLIATIHQFSNNECLCERKCRSPQIELCGKIKSKRLPFETLRKHAYSSILKIFPPKNENFQIKNSDIFHISAQNINCGYSLEPPRRSGSNEYPQFMFWADRGGSNEYPQSMFWAEIRKIMYIPVNPSFTIQKWGLRESKLYRRVFVMQITHTRTKMGDSVLLSLFPCSNKVCEAAYAP